MTTAPEFVHFAEPSSIGDLYVSAGTTMGQELAVLFGDGWHCLLTAGEAAALAALRGISEAILDGVKASA